MSDTQTNMTDYEDARSAFQLEVPAAFNYGRDVVDHQARVRPDAETAVIGVPDRERGQVVKAFVVLAQGQTASPDLGGEIQQFCKESTAPYKYPRHIEFVNELPKTISGKIRRIELREREAATG